MRLPPNCVKFIAALKEIDEKEFWDDVYEDIKEADCDDYEDRFASGDWDDFLDKKKRYFLDGSSWDFVEGIANRKPQIKALFKAPADPTDTESESSVEDFFGDYVDGYRFWTQDYINDFFDRLSNNQKIGAEFKDHVSERISDCYEGEEERRDPYGYRGLSRSMFYASRKVTASDRSALIRLASTMPVGSPERKAILAGLQGKK